VSAEIVTTAAAPAVVTARSGRMGWLDGLRAVAVLLVVYAHLTRYVFRGVRAVSSEWLNAGTAGVMLFFLISGYIIPASLERHGDPRTFWVSRFGRLVPLYLVVGAAVIALGAAGLVPVDPSLAQRPATTAVAHLTMLPFLLGVPLVTPLFWTLTFEMVFYLLVTALFVVRRQRSSGVVAIALAVAAVLVCPLPARLLAVEPVTAVVAALLVAGLAAVVSGRRRAVVAGGVLLGVVALTLPVLNQDPAHVWDGLLVLAVMFAGTTIYRADRGQTSWWPPVLVCAVVAAALLHNWFAELAALDALTPRYRARAVITLLVFGGAFATGMLTRRWRTPRVLSWVGLISYSVYLVHWVLIQLCAPVLAAGLPDPPVAAAFLALVAGVSWLTYRYVELPGQRAANVISRRVCRPPDRAVLPPRAAAPPGRPG
jgi:peptidoglycan/LPS O-acetylase OafA/YrhL